MELQQPPSEKEQQAHNLSHLPFASWCPSCVAYRARSDKHERSGASNRSSIPCISFDFCYTKCIPDKQDGKEVDTITALLMVDSLSGYLHAVPLRSKNQWSLMVNELLGFAGLLGHAELTYRCDNEPTLLQLQRMVINARLSMELVTHKGPTGQIEPSPFVDEDAEAVKAKHLEEVREEEETNEMSLHDRVQPTIEDKAASEPYSPSLAAHDEPVGGIFDDGDELQVASSGSQPLLPESAVSSQANDLTDVPKTPPALDVAPVTPRSSPSTRVHDVDVEHDDHDAKRARVESAKKHATFGSFQQ
eukprot:s881_g12.t1